MSEQRDLNEGIAKQVLNLVFIIDRSGSMSGENIGAVNNALRDVVNLLPEIQDSTSDAIIKISALLFSNDAEWVYEDPKEVNDFVWNDVEAYGMTDLSSAYDKLNDFLTKESRGGKMPDFGGMAPILFLMSDGYPTSPDWEDHLRELQKRGWYKVALKYALAIGDMDDEGKDVLKKFTKNPETVLTVYTAEALRKVIKVIAVTASKVKSNSASAAPGGATPGIDTSTNAIAQQEITEQLQDDDDVSW